MTCSSCVHTIESAVAEMPGVLSVSVALALSRGHFRFDPNKTNIRKIKEEIEAITRRTMFLLYSISVAPFSID